MGKINLLDCTLRDGGYVNDWKFGRRSTHQIIRSLVRAGVDIIEVGFLNKTVTPQPGVTRWQTMDQLKEVLPQRSKRGSAIFSAMCIHNFYDVDLLPQRDETTVDMLRVTFHDYDAPQGLEFCRRAKEKGYLLSCNPINIMGYTDEQVLWLTKEIAKIHPYAMSIVDTHGSMNHRDLQRLVGLVDNNLPRDICLGLHLHENMAQSFSLAQRFVDYHLNRDITVDGSLEGMGRIPGNLPIELMAHYLNENMNTHYDLDPMLDAIEDCINPIKGSPLWGYTPIYFLSAKYNLHRTYAEHLSQKGTLTHRDINHILSQIAPEKKTAFDAEYADQLYYQYQHRQVDDSAARAKLSQELEGKTVLVVAPGSSLTRCADQVENALKEADVAISANFVPDFAVDYSFFTSSKRYDRLGGPLCPVIATSNLTGAQFTIDYDSVCGTFPGGANSVIMLLNLLKDMDVKEVLLAGADGYSTGAADYFDNSYHAHTRRDDQFNRDMAQAIAACGLNLRFVTPSAYQKG